MKKQDELLKHVYKFVSFKYLYNIEDETQTQQQKGLNTVTTIR